ncbi:MAG TPA: AAA family ATPase [Vicinamibacteria bacterium]|nr:AAA family ATPase [Vicinamibacteria bacterium]
MASPPAVPSPAKIAAALGRRVFGQPEAVREMSVALAKKLANLRVGNILLVGSSGSGKTTLMRAVEDMLAADPALTLRSTVVRIHANVLGEDAQQGRAGERVLHRLLERAREQLGADAPADRILAQASHGLVFIDEVDKIRSRVGDQVQVAGIRAQEALLTLIENESVPLRLPDWAGGTTAQVDSSHLLFVCAGAFEGLYETVFARVIQGGGEQALRTTTVSESGRVQEEVKFVLRDWLRSEDLFEYGITPQFLSRFDAVVVLDPLGEAELFRIFAESADSAYRESHAYFASQGIRLEMSEPAARRIAAEAARQPRLGARALKEVFRRVIRSYEFDPPNAPGLADGRLRIEVADVERALARGRDDAAVSTGGWGAG